MSTTTTTPAATNDATDATIQADVSLLGLFLDYLEEQGHEDFRRWLRENDLAESDEHLAVTVNTVTKVVTLGLEKQATGPAMIGETIIHRLRTVEVQRNWNGSRPDQADYEIPLATPTHRIEEVACAEARRLITDGDLSSVELYHTPDVDTDQASAEEFAAEIAKQVGATAEITLLYGEESVEFTVCWKETGNHTEAETALRALNDEVWGFELTFKQPTAA